MASAPDRNIWAVIPAHNEEKNIAHIVAKTKKYVHTVMVVDDGSTDATHELAQQAGAQTLRHIINLGKGAALKTGCDFAAANGANYLIVLDADAQHDPGEIPRFIQKFHEYDIIFGYRKLSQNMPMVLRIGNWLISQAIGKLYHVHLYDTQSGYRAFSAAAYKKIRWDACDYFMESEMIFNVGKNKLRYTQIPIRTIYNDKYKGTTVIDGVKILMNMFLFKFFNHH